jgi:DNA-binding response OmpR family regulator
LLNILIIAAETEKIKELTSRLVQNGLNCSISSDLEKVIVVLSGRSPDLILADINNAADIRQIMDIHSYIEVPKNPLMIVLIPEVMLNDMAENTNIADFVIKPFDINELYIRIKRLARRIKKIDRKQIIMSGDLVIDTASCEVSLGGRNIELTFREYELLRFLATNKGQVFSREALLNKVWKYDYLGGERTVDVHIRRLRSKIRDIDHNFIDTVRNIGYRFRKDT